MKKLYISLILMFNVFAVEENEVDRCSLIAPFQKKLSNLEEKLNSPQFNKLIISCDEYEKTSILSSMKDNLKLILHELLKQQWNEELRALLRQLDNKNNQTTTLLLDKVVSKSLAVSNSLYDSFAEQEANERLEKKRRLSEALSDSSCISSPEGEDYDPTFGIFEMDLEDNPEELSDFE